MILDNRFKLCAIAHKRPGRRTDRASDGEAAVNDSGPPLPFQDGQEVRQSPLGLGAQARQYVEQLPVNRVGSTLPVRLHRGVSFSAASNSS